MTYYINKAIKFCSILTTLGSVVNGFDFTYNIYYIDHKILFYIYHHLLILLICYEHFCLNTVMYNVLNSII